MRATRMPAVAYSPINSGCAVESILMPSQKYTSNRRRDIYGLADHLIAPRIYQWYAQNQTKPDKVWGKNQHGRLHRPASIVRLRYKMMYDLCVSPHPSECISPLSIARHAEIDHSTLFTIVKKLRLGWCAGPV